LIGKIQCFVIQTLVNGLKVKDDNKGYVHTPIPFSKDTHVLDEVIVYDSIIVQSINLGAHKNNNLNVPHHRTRFSLLHTPIIPFTWGFINESSIHDNTKDSSKWWRQRQQPTPIAPIKNPICASQKHKWHAPYK